MNRLREIVPEEEDEGGDIHEGLSNIRLPGGENEDEDEEEG